MVLEVGCNINPLTFKKNQEKLEETYGPMTGNDDEPFGGYFQFRLNGSLITDDMKDIMERKRTVFIPGFGYRVTYVSLNFASDPYKFLSFFFYLSLESIRSLEPSQLPHCHTHSFLWKTNLLQSFVRI